MTTLPLSKSLDLHDHKGDVIVLARLAAKRGQVGMDSLADFFSRTVSLSTNQVTKAFFAELFVLLVVRFPNTIGRNNVDLPTSDIIDRMFFIAALIEKPQRQTALQSPARRKQPAPHHKGWGHRVRLRTSVSGGDPCRWSATAWS